MDDSGLQLHGWRKDCTVLQAFVGINPIEGQTGPNPPTFDLRKEIRQKRGDTLVKTLRKTYGDDFAPGVRSDTRLDTLRERAGGESLSKIVKGE